MSIDTFLDGLNKGGFAFLGMVLVAALLFGGIRFANWVSTKGWPDLMKALGQSGADYKEAANIHRQTAEDHMAQTQRVITLQATMLDNVVAQHRELGSDLKTVIGKADIIIDKLEVRK